MDADVQIIYDKLMSLDEKECLAGLEQFTRTKKVDELQLIIMALSLWGLTGEIRKSASRIMDSYSFPQDILNIHQQMKDEKITMAGFTKKVQNKNSPFFTDVLIIALYPINADYDGSRQREWFAGNTQHYSFCGSEDLDRRTYAVEQLCKLQLHNATEVICSTIPNRYNIEELDYLLRFIEALGIMGDEKAIDTLSNLVYYDTDLWDYIGRDAYDEIGGVYTVKRNRISKAALNSIYMIGGKKAKKELLDLICPEQFDGCYCGTQYWNDSHAKAEIPLFGLEILVKLLKKNAVKHLKKLRDFNYSSPNDSERIELLRRIDGLIKNLDARILPEKIYDKKFVISGKLMDHSRNELKEIIEMCGGKLLGSVSSNVDYLIIGSSPGNAKISKAFQLNIPTINENEILKMIENSRNGVDNVDASNNNDVTVLLNHENPMTRLNILKKIELKKKSFNVSLIGDLLHDEDKKVREQAIKLLIQSNEHDAIELLEEAELDREARKLRFNLLAREAAADLK